MSEPVRAFITPCVEWQGARDEYGYGRYPSRTNRRAHRRVWESAHGPIPEGMLVLHKCDNPPCVNLKHLFLGTHADNIADKIAKGRARQWNTAATHCRKGHAYTPENTYIQMRNGKPRQHCRTCQRIRYREYHAQKRAARV